ncbi:MAG: GNAT family N-acetyltransferase [Gemmatimonadota bacterium]|nr:GNAT family N-acetyltransferase [Gemmatimonadota bacterium]
MRWRPTVLRPHVTLIERDRQPQALAIGRLDVAPLECKFGYKVVYRPTVRLLFFQPVLFRSESLHVTRTLIREFMVCLARGEADVVKLHRIELDSPLHRAVSDIPPWFAREHFAQRETRRLLQVPDSIEEFLASRSHKVRGHIRNLENRSGKKYGARLSLTVFQSLDDIDRMFADLNSIASEAYQRRLGVAFPNTEEARNAIPFALERGWFRAYVLYVDAEPVAYSAGFLYNKTFNYTSVGYKPAYASDSFGRFLLGRIIADLCRDDAVQVMDYGSGDADYKRRFSNRSSEHVHPLIFACVFRAVRINIIRTAIKVAAAPAEEALRRTGLRARVKKRRRKG